MDTDLEFGAARPDDWPGVLAISQGVYAGQDYLPAVYSQWVEEAAATPRPNRFSFVVRQADRIIGYFSMLFTRDHQQFMLSAERVAEDLQGRGIGRRIEEFAGRFAQGSQVQPGGVSHQFVAIGDQSIPDASLARKLAANGEVLLFLSVPLFLVAPVLLQRWAAGAGPVPGQLNGASDLGILLGSADWDALVPGNVLHVNWDPFSPSCQEDLDYILKPGLQNPNKRTFVKGPDSFSILTKPYPVPAGSRVAIDIFAPSLAIFLHHLDLQLQLLAGALPGAASPCRLFLFTPPA
jgi:GNAT superfamily N-acetyltransferase